METMLIVQPMTAFVSRDFEPNHIVRIRVIESIRFFSDIDSREETVVSNNVVSLNIPFLFPFLLPQLTLSLHIESELSNMGFGHSSSELSNRISSYVLNLVYTGCGTISINAYVHIVSDVRIEGGETINIRPDFWVTDYRSGLDETEPLSHDRLRGVMADLMDGVAVIDMHGSDIGSSTPPLRQRGASRSVINRLKNENRFNGKNILGGELDDCALFLEEQTGVEDLIKLPCSHIFHSNCICTWLEKEDCCPICRRKSSNF